MLVRCKLFVAQWISLHCDANCSSAIWQPKLHCKIQSSNNLLELLPHVESKPTPKTYRFIWDVRSISIETSLFQFYVHVERGELYSILDINCGILLSCDKKQPPRITCRQLPTAGVQQSYF